MFAGTLGKTLTLADGKGTNNSFENLENFWGLNLFSLFCLFIWFGIMK